MSDSESLYEKAQKLAAKYPGMDLKSINHKDGVVEMYVGMNGVIPPDELPDGIEILREEAATNPSELIGAIYDEASISPTVFRTPRLNRSDTDIMKRGISQSSPHELYERSLRYYREKDVYGSTINILSNFASKGFENDIDDPTIKNFFDNWVIDTNFEDIVDKIFLDFFRVGLVRTYKINGKYKPKVNHLSSVPGQKPKKIANASQWYKEEGARKKKFSNTYIPIAYTILNPLYVEIKGSLLFGQTLTYLKAKAGEELKEILDTDRSKLNKYQKRVIDNLPANFKKAVKAGEDIPLEPEKIGEIDYRRMPYERYPIPRGAKSFDALDFKDELRKADASTLDGITNYILKITVGNDNLPVKNQDVLETVGRMFDRTSKSFKVVWNHTLNVEKITSDDVGDILGQDKYKQTNEDITAGLAFPRALLDGVAPGATKDSLNLAIKSVIEEIYYARKQVTRWIYNEYRQVAEAMGFERYPKVRFDDMALRDELQMMAIVQGMIDRRIISYRTGQKKLGFDPDTEVSQLKEEKPLVVNGDLGLIGSPFQQSSGVQENQRTPKGTPSEGRPKGKPAKKPDPKDKSKPPKTKTKEQVTDNSASASDTATSTKIEDLSIDELAQLVEATRAKKQRLLEVLKGEFGDVELLERILSELTEDK